MFEYTEEDIYGCWNCGEIQEEYHLDDDGKCICSLCGAPAIVGLQEALDTLKDLNLKGLYKHDD